MAAAPSKWISNRRLNSLTAIAQPIYQHAHGPRTVRHLGSKIKGLSKPVCCRRTGQDREAIPSSPAARRSELPTLRSTKRAASNQLDSLAAQSRCASKSSTSWIGRGSPNRSCAGHVSCCAASRWSRNGEVSFDRTAVSLPSESGGQASQDLWRRHSHFATASTSGPRKEAPDGGSNRTPSARSPDPWDDVSAPPQTSRCRRRSAFLIRGSDCTRRQTR